MQRYARIAALVLAGAALTVSVSDALAQTAAPASAPTQFYPFLGYWKGHGQYGAPGKDPAQLALSLSCRRAVAGWAVRCDFVGRGDTMTFVEADLMGVDPVTGIGHWYAVNNQGDTHDHIAEWTDAKTMIAHYEWEQNGKQMRENVIVRFPREKQHGFPQRRDRERAGSRGLLRQHVALKSARGRKSGLAAQPGIGLDLDQHFGGDEARDLHQRGRRPDRAEHCAVRLADLLPVPDVDHVDPGAHHL